ncbi:MAG: DUF222 domain-containing protein, partial [Actinomycetes bacterium]
MRPIEERDVTETLDACESAWLAKVEADCEIFVSAVHFAHLCNGEDLPARVRRSREGGVLPGTERRVRLGGAGTPRVAEFAAAELGARLRMGSRGAKALIADALDTRHRLPRLWARVTAGQARVGWVRYVAQATRELSVEAAALVDAAVADLVDGRVPWSRFETIVAGQVAAADPDLAARKEEQARARAHARASRHSEAGMKAFHLWAPTAVVVALDATVAYLAAALAALGDTDTEDERRVKACAILANPMHAVELLAAFARHRTRTTPPPGPPEPPTGPDANSTDDEPNPDTATPDRAEPGTDLHPVPRKRLLDGSAPPPPPGFGRTGGFPHEPPGPPDPGPPEDPLGPEDFWPPPDHDPEETAPAADAEPDDAASAGGGAHAERLLRPRRFRPDRLPDWLRRAVDPATGWHLDTSRLLPTVTLYLHLAQETVEHARTGNTNGILRLADDTPLTLRYLYSQIVPHQRLRVTPVIDLAGQEPVDSYEIPRRHREALRLRTPADCFPYAASLTPGEIDHTTPYRHDGTPAQSRMDNYSPLGRFHHRVKTHGRWQLRQPFPGIYLWRDPHGAHYLVDHTGTR